MRAHPFLKLVVVFQALMVAAAGPVVAAPPAKAPDLTPKLVEIETSQAELAAAVNRLQEQIGGLDSRVSEVQSQLAASQEAAGNDREFVKELREEVRGLYVESSSTKDMVSKVGERVDDLGGSLERFRFSAGILLAVMLGLQIIGIALAFRRA